MRIEALQSIELHIHAKSSGQKVSQTNQSYSQSTYAVPLERADSFMVPQNEYPMVLIPSLAAKLGGSDEALFVTQLHYWLCRSGHMRSEDGNLWIWNSADDWLKQFLWLDRYSLQRVISKLEKLGVVLSEQYQRRKWNQTKWYRLDYGKLIEIGWNPHGYALRENAQSIARKCTIDSAFSRNDPYLQRLHSEITLSPPTPSQEKEKEIEQKYLEEGKPGNIPHPLAAIEIEIGIADHPVDLKKDNPSDSSPNDDKAIKLEWEAASGQPYPDFIKWRSQHYVDQGGHWAKAASANAKSEIRNKPSRAADLWEQFLNYANRAADSALAHKDNGMVPILPPCFQESRETAVVTKESVTAKLAAITPTALTAELTPVVPAAVITPTALTAELTPVVPAAVITPPSAENVGAYKLFSPEEIEVSPMPDSFRDAFSQLITKQSMPKNQRLRDTSPPPIFLTQPDLAAARETWAALPSLRDEIRSEIAAHPDWDLEVVDGSIQEVSF